MVLHLYLSAIMIISFMVACLESIYNEFLEIASFKLKHYLYEYSNHYFLSFKDDNFGPLIVQPAPINILVLFTVPFFPYIKMMSKVSDFFQKFNFWMENIFLLSLFIMQEVVYSPIVYVQTFINIYNSIKDRNQSI